MLHHNHSSHNHGKTIATIYNCYDLNHYNHPIYKVVTAVAVSCYIAIATSRVAGPSDSLVTGCSRNPGGSLHAGGSQNPGPSQKSGEAFRGPLLTKLYGGFQGNSRNKWLQSVVPLDQTMFSHEVVMITHELEIQASDRRRPPFHSRFSIFVVPYCHHESPFLTIINRDELTTIDHH